jgi:hypothetical protein
MSAQHIRQTQSCRVMLFPVLPIIIAWCRMCVCHWRLVPTAVRCPDVLYNIVLYP